MPAARLTIQKARAAAADLFARAAGAGLLVPIAALIACLILIWGLAEIADEVQDGESFAFDQWTLLLLRTPGDTDSPIGPPWLQHVALELTTLGGTTVLAVVVLVGVGYLMVRGSYAAAFALAVAAIAGQIMSSLLKIGFGRQRPDIVAHLTDVHTLSFPSGHATMAAVVWLTVGALLAQAPGPLRVRIYFLAAAAAATIIIGLTRIYLGVHYPTDVLAGWAAGAAWASLWWGVVAWWRRWRSRSGERARPPEAHPA